jgi:exodeoxyribonuclease V alpha subunit
MSLTLAISMAYQDGHTVLTKSDAQFYARKNNMRWTQAEIDNLTADGTVVRVGADYGLSKHLYSEARIVVAMAPTLPHNQRKARTLPTPVLGSQTSSLSTSQLKETALLLTALGTGGVATLTGRPGSGKTYLTARLIEVIKAAGISVACCAPTGKAASVLSLKVGCEVTTIHRLIGYRPGQLFVENPIHADVVVVDEASMIDSFMMANLLECCRDHVKFVLLVGDPNQLPPVEAGCPFLDLTRAETITHAHLSEPQRQAEGSGILALANDFMDGLVGPRYPNVHLFKPADIYREAVDLYCSDRISKRFGLDDVQRQALLLSPVKKEKFTVSTENLNTTISHRLHPDRNINKLKFTTNDRVMFTVNDYGHGYVNGEMGTLVAYKPKGRLAHIVNDSGKDYNLEDYNLAYKCEWAYALTVHKSQGSESEVVILLLDKQARFMYTKNLIYTAITRAKKELIIMGDWQLLVDAAKKPEVRHTALSWLLEHLDVAERICNDNGTADLSAFVNGLT